MGFFKLSSFRHVRFSGGLKHFFEFFTPIPAKNDPNFDFCIFVKFLKTGLVQPPTHFFHIFVPVQYYRCDLWRPWQLRFFTRPLRLMEALPALRPNGTLISGNLRPSLAEPWSVLVWLVATQTFWIIFTPKIGEVNTFDEHIFSDGLKPPTSCRWCFEIFFQFSSEARTKRFFLVKSFRNGLTPRHDIETTKEFWFSLVFPDFGLYLKISLSSFGGWNMNSFFQKWLSWVFSLRS